MSLSRYLGQLRRQLDTFSAQSESSRSGEPHCHAGTASTDGWAIATSSLHLARHQTRLKSSDQNACGFTQVDDQVYLVTIRAIHPGTELRYVYDTPSPTYSARCDDDVQGCTIPSVSEQRGRDEERECREPSPQGQRGRWNISPHQSDFPSAPELIIYISYKSVCECCVTHDA